MTKRSPKSNVASFLASPNRVFRSPILISRMNHSSPEIYHVNFVKPEEAKSFWNSDLKMSNRENISVEQKKLEIAQQKLRKLNEELEATRREKERWGKNTCSDISRSKKSTSTYSNLKKYVLRMPHQNIAMSHWWRRPGHTLGTPDLDISGEEGREFPPEVPGRAEDITIPGDLTPEKIPTLIADYNALEQNEEALSEELLRADVICIVYAVDDLESLESVSDHWIPLIRRTLESQKTPLILVGNKVDLSEYSTMEAVLQMMNEYEEIETCVECSAKNLKNISEMFYFAQKAVLHPSAPLFDHQKKDLTTACKRALTRVFMLCDEDNDALLSDEEINKFQRRCFGLDLEPGILENLKSVVHKNCPEGLSKMTGQLTLSGFLALHGLFIQKGRNETTWTMLRKFGYDEDLTLSRDYLYPSFSAPSNSIIELSNIGYDFLTFIFEKYDKDSDKAMSPQEIIDLFSTCPLLFPSQKIKKWMLARNQTPRNIYRCNIIGPKGAGKTTFCQGLLGRSIDDIKNIPSYEIPKHTINSIQVYGQEKYLILEDVDVLNVSSPSIPSESNCDVCCLVYDASDPRSFEFVAAVFLKYYVDSKVPVLIVANKSDLPSVRQDYILQPEAFCAKHKLPPPQPYNTKGRVKNRYVRQTRNHGSISSFSSSLDSFL
ncbi:RHOT1 [Lepeophtheirus salmonis]|uniref:RHOT1 n=1 Tax=Lepeophtheirus salmonis TaxID=72036 RepID=A0A7R8HAM9_LEPSM|nr:RHOT1 [Lepeophtheirus salmonis]CAF2973160.1 RHOT1 [Lepeophtheirus salmonis]